MCPYRSLDLIDALRKLLAEGFEGTQEEICDALASKGLDVNQSTVSRALRKVGVVKSMSGGRVAYRLGDAKTAGFSGSVRDLVHSIEANEALIVIKTAPGSAAFVGDFLDRSGMKNNLGILAGDDTVFIAPKSVRDIAAAVEEVRHLIRGR